MGVDGAVDARGAAARHARGQRAGRDEVDEPQRHVVVVDAARGDGRERRRELRRESQLVAVAGLERARRTVSETVVKLAEAVSGTLPSATGVPGAARSTRLASSRTVPIASRLAMFARTATESDAWSVCAGAAKLGEVQLVHVAERTPRSVEKLERRKPSPAPPLPPLAT